MGDVSVVGVVRVEPGLSCRLSFPGLPKASTLDWLGVSLHRVVRYRVRSIDEVARATGHLDHLIVDFDGTLAPFAKGHRDRAAIVASLRTLITSLALKHAMVVSNARPSDLEWLRDIDPAITVVADARKPWTSRTALRCQACVDEGRSAILGDQEATDGLLAWRLGIPFVHLCRSDPAGSPGFAIRPLLHAPDAQASVNEPRNVGNAW